MPIATFAFIHKNSIADVYIHASIQPLDTPKGAPPDPLTQKKTFDALARARHRQHRRRLHGARGL
jgi:hypothetical protein